MSLLSCSTGYGVRPGAGVAPTDKCMPAVTFALGYLQVIQEHERLSQQAYAVSQQQTPEMVFYPPGGPLGIIVLPPVDAALPSQPDKYHVAVTADCGKYGRWQTLVRFT
jgi:hypothetical protein